MKIRTYPMLFTDCRNSVGKYLCSKNILCSKNAYAMLVYSSHKTAEGHFLVPEMSQGRGRSQLIIIGSDRGMPDVFKKHYQTAGLGWNQSIHTFLQFFPII